ncbi:MAG: DUF2505 domain-containing protein [Stenotrophobium sp.]
MQFEDRHVFDKPAATVMTMYVERSFFERKYKDLGGWDIEVLDHEKSDTKFRIKCRYTTKASIASIPSFAQKFIGSSITLIQQDTWDIKARTGWLDIEMKNAPVRIHADMTLRDEAGVAINAMKWNVSCGIPLIGGKLEQLVADDIKAKSGKDAKVSQIILNDY